MHKRLIFSLRLIVSYINFENFDKYDILLSLIMITVRENIELKDLNSFGVSAKAAEFIEFNCKEDLKEIFELIGDKKWRVISGGNNILFTSDWQGTLIHPTMKEVDIISESERDVVVRVDAGLEWDDFVNWATDREFWGVENLALIPGYVGAAPVQNIGAYGVEVKDVIESVEMFCVDSRNFLSLHNSHCQFGYRESVFKGLLKDAVIITSVTFRLSKIATPKLDYGDLKSKVDESGGATIKSIQKAVIEIRESKLPDTKVTGNVGSFFKNPIVDIPTAERLKIQYPDMPLYASENGAKIPAGWLIDRAGWKGVKDGNVGIDPRQALVVINLGGATGIEILEFARKVQKDIKNRFEIDIEMEVNVL